MKKIDGKNFTEGVESLKKVVMENQKKVEKIDPKLLKQELDSVEVNSLVHKYDPEVQAYVKVVKEGTGGILDKLEKKFKREIF